MRVAAEAAHAGRSPEDSPGTRAEKGRHAPTRQGRVAAWFLQMTARDGARMETVNPEVAGSSPVEPAIFSTRLQHAIRGRTPKRGARLSESLIAQSCPLSSRSPARNVTIIDQFLVGYIRSSDTLGHSSDAAEARRVVQEGHRRGPDEGGQRQPADSRAPGFAVRRANLRAVQECARRRLDPLPSLRAGSTPEPNIRIGPDA
jgi:hypothetical protein